MVSVSTLGPYTVSGGSRHSNIIMHSINNWDGAEGHKGEKGLSPGAVTSIRGEVKKINKSVFADEGLLPQQCPACDPFLLSYFVKQIHTPYFPTFDKNELQYTLVSRTSNLIRSSRPFGL